MGPWQEKKCLYLHGNNLAQVFHVITDENEAQTGGLTKASEKARTGSQVFRVPDSCSLIQQTFPEHSVVPGLVSGAQVGYKSKQQP